MKIFFFWQLKKFGTIVDRKGKKDKKRKKEKNEYSQKDKNGNNKPEQKRRDIKEI